MTFDFEETEKSFTVNIINDSLYENTENFFLDLEIPPEAVLKGVFKGSPASTKIEIANDDSKYCIMTYTLDNTLCWLASYGVWHKPVEFSSEFHR